MMDILSTVGDVQYCGGIMVNVGDILSKMGDVPYCGDIMIHVGIS